MSEEDNTLQTSTGKKTKYLHSQVKKQEMEKYLKLYKGHVSKACEKVGIDRTTHYYFMDNDPEYKQHYEAIGEALLDNVEKNINELCDEKNPTILMFVAKTKGKNRGWVEPAEATINIANVVNAYDFNDALAFFEKDKKRVVENKIIEENSDRNNEENNDNNKEDNNNEETKEGELKEEQ